MKRILLTVIELPIKTALIPIFLGQLLHGLIKCKGEILEFINIADQAIKLNDRVTYKILNTISFGLYHFICYGKPKTIEEILAIPIEEYEKDLQKAENEGDHELAEILRESIRLRKQIDELEKQSK